MLCNTERNQMTREDNLNQLKLALHEDFLAKKQEWLEWHTANPMVWKMFEQFAFQAVKMNKSKISHWLIINRIRWETSIMTTGNDFKISNDYIAFYARHWKETYPQYSNLFNTKRMIGESL
jgi:hypothetical protein